MNSRFDYAILDAINNAMRSVKASPLILGATASGYGGPTGGFVGWLPQTRVSYDTVESGNMSTPISGMSLLDNLNHIRGRITVLESGGMVTSFLDLTDTPNTYSGHAGKSVVVNGTEDGLTFTTISGGGGVEEAPIDGNPYSRKNAGWVVSSGTFTENSSIWVPDAYPTLSGTLDDEFDDLSLAAKWDAFSPGTAALEYNELIDGLHTWNVTVSGVAGLLQDAPVDPFYVWTKVSITGTQGGPPGFALIVGNDLTANPTTADFYTIGFSIEADDRCALRISHWTNYQTLDINHYEDLTTLPLGSVYMRIGYNGSLVIFDYSMDGRTWISRVSTTYTPGQVGIVSMDSENGEGVFSFFRSVGYVGTFDIMHGNRVAIKNH